MYKGRSTDRQVVKANEAALEWTTNGRAQGPVSGTDVRFGPRRRREMKWREVVTDIHRHCIPELQRGLDQTFFRLRHRNTPRWGIPYQLWVPKEEGESQKVDNPEAALTAYCLGASDGQGAATAPCGNQTGWGVD